MRLRSALAFAALASLVLTTAAPSSAQTGNAVIAGQLVEQNGGLGIPGATVQLQAANGTTVSTTTTDRGGRFSFTAPPATYAIVVRAEGYVPLTSTGVTATAGSALVERFALQRAAGGAQNQPDVIGRIVSRSAATQNLQSSATLSSTLQTQALQQEGQFRIADKLQTLPGVTTATSSSQGDDINLQIRGSKTSDVAALLDGHAIGPLGVYPDRAPGKWVNGFNYAASPIFGIQNVQVTYGSGAIGIYGIDATAGAVDFQTIDPTTKPAFSLQQGVGTQGRALTAGTATGTVGRLGYALEHGVEGTYGQFAPQQIQQTGLLGSDISSGNVAANTYAVSANAVLRADLGKLRYSLGSGGALQFTYYDAAQWADSTGNGDNDYFTYEQQLYNYTQGVAANGPATGCTAAAPVQLSTNTGPTCYSAAQAAQLTYGPAGGGAGRQRTTRLNDYNLRYTAQVGIHNFTIGGFQNVYSFIKDSTAAGGDIFNVRYKTTGFVASDDMVAGNNDFGFGYYAEHQLSEGNDLQPGNTSFASLGQYTFGDGNVFLRDTWTATDQLSLFANLWFKRANTAQATSLEPRISVVFRPSPQDVVRASFGSAVGEPAPQLLYAPASVNPTVNSLNSNCFGLTSVGSTPNLNLTRESATDLELAYGHRFRSDTVIQADAYRHNVQNVLFSGQVPLASTGIGVDPTILASILGRIKSQCAATIPNPSVANLSVASFFNGGSAVQQGFDITGRLRMDRQFYLDYAYDVESSVRNGMTDAVLMSNPTFINGAQLANIPLQKGSLGIGFDGPGGISARLDGTFLAQNNSYNRGPMMWWDLGVVQRLRNVDLNLGVSNLFDSYNDSYGRVGYGLYQPVNAFNTNLTNAFDEQVEQFGLPSRSITFTATFHT